MRKCSAAASGSNAPNKEHPADGTRRTGAPRRRNPPNRERPADETRRIGAPRRRNPPNRECRTRGTRRRRSRAVPLCPRAQSCGKKKASGGAQAKRSAPRRFTVYFRQIRLSRPIFVSSAQGGRRSLPPRPPSKAPRTERSSFQRALTWLTKRSPSLTPKRTERSSAFPCVIPPRATASTVERSR